MATKIAEGANWSNALDSLWRGVLQQSVDVAKAYLGMEQKDAQVAASGVDNKAQKEQAVFGTKQVLWLVGGVVAVVLVLALVFRGNK